MIKDPFGRPITNLRISITQRCNLNCIYCHREGENYTGNTEMKPEEIQRIVRIAASFGVERVKITGGEPLLRSDVLDVVSQVKAVSGIKEVAMTTNGILLSNIAKKLRDAGLSRINISLSTLKPETFQKISRTTLFKKVIKGIKEAVKTDLSPVKINMVVLKSINENHIWDTIQFSKKNGLILQLIEFESGEENSIYKKYHTNLDSIEKKLEDMSTKVSIRSMQHRKKYFLSGGGEVEVVKPMHNTEFCSNCTKIRVTSDGKLKPCLFRSDNLVDFINPIRSKASNTDLKKIFILAVSRRKPYFTN